MCLDRSYEQSGTSAVAVAVVETSPTILHLFQMIKGRLSRDLRMPLPLVALFQSSNYFFWLVYLRLQTYICMVTITNFEVSISCNAHNKRDDFELDWRRGSTIPALSLQALSCGIENFNLVV